MVRLAVPASLKKAVEQGTGAGCFAGGLMGHPNTQLGERKSLGKERA